MHVPRPSSWVDVRWSARLASRGVRVSLALRAAVLGASLLPTAWVSGCGGSSPEAPDAAMRLDATIVETGLAFEDATLDASGPTDALTPQRDGGSSLCRGACDPVRAAGCGTGELCVLRDVEATCGPPSRGTRGSPCTSVDECAAGLACFLGDSGGVCDRVCCPGGADCAADEVCGGDGRLVDETATSWGRCLVPRTCALLDAMACPEREACYVIGPLGESECLLAGAALEGEACTLPNDCAPELVCAGAVERTCARLCRLGLPTDPCGSGSMCVRQAYTPDGVGVCVTAAARMR